MDSPSTDFARLILRHLNITSKYQLSCVNKFWRSFFKEKEWVCRAKHTYHCKLCTSRINNSGICCNMTYSNKCIMCKRTFCKHLQHKKCGVCGKLYDKNKQICGICSTCPCKISIL